MEANAVIKLAKVQQELRAPKSQYNSYGGFAYRSCEDILEALKPILSEHGCTVVLSDEIVNVGASNYVKATAKLTDLDTGEEVQNTAYAREAVTKKGMDDAQITGTASSYARKYALGGLLLIDDNKDSDTDEFAKQTTEAVVCHKCGNPVKPQRKKDSAGNVIEIAPADVLKGCGGVCYSCWKAGQK